jgi:hypothetical protein
MGESSSARPSKRWVDVVLRSRTTIIVLVGAPKTKVEAETTFVEPAEPDRDHSRVGNNATGANQCLTYQ